MISGVTSKPGVGIVRFDCIYIYIYICMYDRGEKMLKKEIHCVYGKGKKWFIFLKIVLIGLTQLLDFITGYIKSTYHTLLLMQVWKIITARNILFICFSQN